MLDNAHWQPTLQLLLPAPNAALLSHLTYPGSLTKRLQQHAKQQIKVRILNQCWSYPQASEAQALAVPRRQKVWQREVHLMCGEEIWLYGRAIFPASFLTTPLRFVRHLNAQPLGKFLFRYPDLKRSPFHYAKLLPYHWEYRHATQSTELGTQALWARRSCMSLAKQDFLLTEVYFPAWSKHHVTATCS
jgi:chorismate lyase